MLIVVVSLTYLFFVDLVAMYEEVFIDVTPAIIVVLVVTIL